MKAVYLNENDLKFVRRTYPEALHARLNETFELEARVLDRAAVLRGEAVEAEVAFSTWGMLEFTEAEIAQYLPNLKAVFYGAGTVQYFARPFLNRGITVVSAWAANGVPVAEVTVSEIILSNKGAFRAMRLMREGDYAACTRLCAPLPGNYGAAVGLIGCGVIGRQVIRLLKQADIHLQIKVFDPFLPEAVKAELGIETCSLEEIFATCSVVSNHLANNAQTVGMLDYELFSRMLPTATFINTGRGAQVVEADLIRALREEPGRTALLDVTLPEPPEAGHPFYTMDNVFMTPHIAGSVQDEIVRMGEYMACEAEAFVQGEPLKYAVSMAMLETMA